MYPDYPEARNTFAPLSTKTTVFEVKNRCKSAEEAKNITGILYFFEGNNTHSALEINSTKLE